MSARTVMCNDGVTVCPEPEHTGCTNRGPKLCDDYDLDSEDGTP